jgi:hypothetical protein
MRPKGLDLVGLERGVRQTVRVGLGLDQDGQTARADGTEVARHLAPCEPDAVLGRPERNLNLFDQGKAPSTQGPLHPLLRLRAAPLTASLESGGMGFGALRVTDRRERGRAEAATESGGQNGRSPSG